MMLDSRVNILRWDDHPPFAQLGEPWELDDSQNFDEILEAYRREMFGGGRSADGHNRDYLLGMVERYEDLVRIFDGVPGNDLVLPRLHKFMQSRHRTPRQVLTRDEAVRLAHEQLEVLFDCMQHRLNTPERWLKPHLVEAIEIYRERLARLQIRAVDSTSATSGAIQFGKNGAGTGDSAREDLAFSREELGLRGRAGLVKRATTAIFPFTNLTLVQGLENEASTLEPVVWNLLRELVSGLTDFGYNELTGHILAPILHDRFDSEPFYRMWEGGASLWIGTDAIEVRTDWAPRWPNARYVD